MRRIHFIELEDLAWWPGVVRDLATDYLRFMETKFALHRPVVPLLEAALRECGTTRLVDLCSGGAGPVVSLVAELRARGLTVSAVLTDKFPNADAFADVAGASGGAISFEPAPVDAQSVPERLSGFRTIFNAFHHFPPAAATAVLRDAVEARQPIGVFEIPERSVGNLVPFLFTPLYVVLVTPFIRPFRWDRFFWTYLLPLVTLTCWWDGIVSQLRAYHPAELEALAAPLPPGHHWRAGRVPIGHVPGHLTYLIGLPDAKVTS